jgi:hypothetical protein
VFGERLSFAHTPTLARFYADAPIAAIARGVLGDGPRRITGMVAEAEILAKISKLLG